MGKTLGALAVVALVVAGCGSDEADSTPTDAPVEATEPPTEATEPPTEATEAAPASDAPTGDTQAVATTEAAAETTAGEPAEDPADVSISFCFQGSRDVALVALLATLDEMAAEGYPIETPFLSDTELCTDGVIRDEFQFAVGTTPALAAFAAGADNLRLVGSRNLNGQLIVGQADLATCDDLDGKTFAIHSEGSVMAALFRNWKGENCSEGTSVDELVISGSGNRTQALIAGQVDATGVEQQDEATLELQYGGKYTILARLAETMPELVSGAIYTTTDFAEAHPGAVTELLTRLTEIPRRWDADREAYRAAITKYVPEMDTALVDYFVDDLGPAGLYPTNGGLTLDAVQFTIDLFVESGALENQIAAADVTDMSYLEAALEDVGVELSVINEI